MYENYGLNNMKGMFFALAANYRVTVKGVFSALEENVIYGLFGYRIMDKAEHD